MNQNPDIGFKSIDKFETHSFVIRIWKENRANPNNAAIWRGWIRHVQTDQKQYFQSSQKISQIVGEYLLQDRDLNNSIKPLNSSIEE